MKDKNKVTFERLSSVQTEVKITGFLDSRGAWRDRRHKHQRNEPKGRVRVRVSLRLRVRSGKEEGGEGEGYERQRV